MTYLKHTTHTDALDTLGTIITDAEKRDAIHLAVYPIESGDQLSPGEHIVRGDDGKAYLADERGKGVGIVDPFLTKMVTPGQWFWLVVYPRQISSLRHVWEHPAFPISGETTGDKLASEQWLRNFCDSGGYDTPSYETLIRSIEHHDIGEEYLTIGGEDASGSIPDEMWFHASVVLGRDLGRKPDYFSCSC